MHYHDPEQPAEEVRMPTASYPKVSAKAWNTLRARAAAAPSTKFTPTYVAPMLNLANPKSASDNVLGAMRRLGIITDDGSLTAIGNKWRIDVSYADACQEIIDKVYPEELAGLTDSAGAPDPTKIHTWFQHQGFGGTNAQQMANTYIMIAEKEIPDSVSESKRSEPARRSPRKSESARRSRRSAENGKSGETAVLNGKAVQPEFTPPPEISRTDGPNIHLDIQIHIPIEASPEQIDQIFASMAKHLYSK
jgi:hypothetical protein